MASYAMIDAMVVMVHRLVRKDSQEGVMTMVRVSSEEEAMKYANSAWEK